MNIGDSAVISKVISPADVAQFADLSMDHNPIHTDEAAAAESIFGKPVAHGLYVASFFSAVIAEKLPGPGSIYLKQDLVFKRPVYIGDVIEAKVTVLNFPKPTQVLLSTVCTNQAGEVVIEGTALIKIGSLS